ncbi:MAG: oligosaccharide flippase family protein [Caldimonas sp.]
MKVAAGAASARPGLLSNSRWNLAAFACGLGANFIVVPFVVRWIGLPSFGRAGLVIAVCAPLTLIGTVLGQALVREVSARLGRGDQPGAARTLHEALRIGLVASVLAAVALIAFGPLIVRALIGSEASAADLRTAFAIAAAGWLAQQVALMLQGAAAARQDYRTIARVAALGAIATVTATLAVTAWRPDAEGYLAGMSAGFALTLLAWWVATRRTLDARALLSPLETARIERRALLQFGGWQGLAQLAGAFGNQIDRYTLGALAPVAVVGQYNVANRLQEAAYIGVVKGGEVLFPHFGSLSSRSAAERAEFFMRASWIVGTFSAMLLAPLVPLAHPVLALWVGADAASGADVLLRTLVLGGLVGCGTNVFTYYAMGIGRNQPVAWISVAYSVLTVVGTIVLIRAYGPLAAGGGLLAASVMRIAAALVVTRHTFFPGLAWADLVVSTILPVAVGVAVALGAQGLDLGDTASWIGAGLRYAAFAAVVLMATVLLTLATRSGRDIVRVTAGHWPRAAA